MLILVEFRGCFELTVSVLFYNGLRMIKLSIALQALEARIIRTERQPKKASDNMFSTFNGIQMPTSRSQTIGQRLQSSCPSNFGLNNDTRKEVNSLGRCAEQ